MYVKYIKTQMVPGENQMKRYHWDQDQIAHMKNCIANLNQQAQS